MLRIDSLLTYENTLASELLKKYEYPWEVLPEIKDYILNIAEQLDPNLYTEIFPQVWVHNSVKIAPTASINGPCIIDEGSEIRHCAFIRGSALIGKNCVVGNSCELKNSILIEKVEVPHYNYVGDSILGIRAHLGAGAITSNIKSDRKNIIVRHNDTLHETGLRKIGAIVGDGVEVGCNSVLNPGTIIGRGSRIYPLSMVRGYVPANSIYKSKQDICELD